VCVDLSMIGEVLVYKFTNLRHLTVFQPLLTFVVFPDAE
jgi:hypothetical protein